MEANQTRKDMFGGLITSLILPSRHYTLDQRWNEVQNDVTTSFQLHFNVVPMSDARWVVPWVFYLFFFHIFNQWSWECCEKHNCGINKNSLLCQKTPNDYSGSQTHNSLAFLTNVIYFLRELCRYLWGCLNLAHLTGYKIGHHQWLKSWLIKSISKKTSSVFFLKKLKMIVYWEIWNNSSLNSCIKVQFNICISFTLT